MKLDEEKILPYVVQMNLFKPELLNRFDATVLFHPLTKENLADLLN